ncbi:hypothetical protein BN12_790038 [Nostocoides japonicum T1-X7]|uniref:HTH gntR-type domain-containing protein n=1 Tax=Nostocoides japonicum T1-X7 TaxID=1194083 RepID=A0A077M808_9MICO|nr:hypothetical protein BN12_790038 [Tetrasphaera japonica T1-X7]
MVAAGAIGIPVDTGPRPDRVDVFWERVLAGAPSPVDLAVAASGNVTVPAALRPATVYGDASGWTALLPYLAGCREGAIGPPAADLETRLRQWHRSGRGWFSWVADDVEPGPPDAPEESASTRRPSPERALADDVVATIRAGVREGRFAGGDHVTDRYLAERLHTTRGQIRSALRLLERDGLVTAIAGHAAVIPIPTTADVVETYAARRALGVLMVRAATRWTPSGRKAVLAVLEELDRCAVDDDVERANRLDQTFQVALADASGLTRIGPMLGLLSDQILMFIAVIGIRYAFPTEGIVRRDHELFAAVDAGDLDGAVESWRAKMDESASYMLQLSRTPAAVGGSGDPIRSRGIPSSDRWRLGRSGARVGSAPPCREGLVELVRDGASGGFAGVDPDGDVGAVVVVPGGELRLEALRVPLADDLRGEGQDEHADRR